MAIESEPTFLLQDQLEKALLQAIAKGGIYAGRRFPSRRRIEQSWAVSRPTVEAAVRRLVSRGILLRQGPRTLTPTTDARKKASILVAELSFPALPPAADRSSRNPEYKGKTLHEPEPNRFSVVPENKESSQNRKAHVPIDEHLTKSLLLEVASGIYAEREKFLSRRNIAAMWQVSPGTANRALENLVRNGVLKGQPKSIFLLESGAYRRAQLLLSQTEISPLPPPKTWQNQRRRILGRSRPEGYRLAAVIDEAAIDWKKFAEIGGGWTFEDTRTKINNQWYLLGFLQEANRHFCEVEFLRDDRSANSWERILQEVDRKCFDGVAVFQRINFYPRRGLLKELKQRNIPVLTVLDSCEGEADASVEFNDTAAGHEAMKILLEQGHRDIVYMLGPQRNAANRSKLEGALACIRQMGLKDKVHLRPVRQLITPRNLETIRQWFSNKSDMPTAAFCEVIGHFERISGILKQAKIRIPRDFSVMGFGSAYTDSEIYGILDVMEKNLAILGQRAAEMLVAMIAGNPVERTLQLPIPYLSRGSVRPPRKMRGKKNAFQQETIGSKTRNDVLRVTQP